MKEFLTRAEISRALKVSDITIDRWRREGLPFIKVKSRVLFDEEKVMKWLNENNGQELSKGRY